jgi:hypothetical protein
VSEQRERQDAVLSDYLEIFKHMTTLDTALITVVFVASSSEAFAVNTAWAALGLVGIGISLLTAVLGMVGIAGARIAGDVAQTQNGMLNISVGSFILVLFGELAIAGYNVTLSP